MKLSKQLLLLYCLFFTQFFLGQKKMDTNVQSIIDSNFSDKEKISKIQIILERFKDPKNTPHFANAY